MGSVQALLRYLRALISPAYWKYVVSPGRVLTALLSSFGGLWLLVEVSSFFSSQLAQVFRNSWWVFLLLGVGLAAWMNRPRHEAICRLSGRDVSIVIRVADMFSLPGAVVIGTNTTFDTDLVGGIIAPNSVQGQFTRRYYGAVTHLDTDLAGALTQVTVSRSVARGRGKENEYPIGTTVRVVAPLRTAYFVAIASLNEYGVAQGSFDDLKISLPQLWETVRTRGGFERLVMPVLGSGYARLTQTREEIIREIIQSFVAACASYRPTDSLTIVIPPLDFYEHGVDLRQLESYLQHICRYTEYRTSVPHGGGEPVG